MEITVEYHLVCAFPLFLCWILVEFFMLRKVVCQESRRVFRDRFFTVIPEIIPIVCLLNFIIHLGFCVYLAWRLETISLGSFSQSGSWILVTLFAFYCKEKVVRGHTRWPLVLVSWWVLSALLQLCSIPFFFISHFNLAALPWFLPVSSVADLASFPFSAFLCFGSVSMNSSRTLHELKQSLLVKTEEEKENGVLGEVFSGAGLWNRLTFQWLNPVFEKGRAQRLELPHIPSVPQSETAEAAYSSLRESLHEQKPEFSPLLRAIISAVRRSLVINAVFAGIKFFSSLFCVRMFSSI